MLFFLRQLRPEPVIRFFSRFVASCQRGRLRCLSPRVHHEWELAERGASLDPSAMRLDWPLGARVGIVSERKLKTLRIVLST